MRLDRVLIATRRGTIQLPRASRDALLDELGNLDGAQRIRDTLAAVGASRPAEFTQDDKQLLIDAIRVWASNVGAQRLPAGVWGLRNALVDDIHDDAGDK